MGYIQKVDEKLTEYSVQQVSDCDKDNYGCTGGWMYQAFAYISSNGVFKKEDYKPYVPRQETCDTTQEKLAAKGHFKDIGFVEYDRRTNQQLKEILQSRPVSVGMYTPGMLGAYKTGVVTEDFLHCSYPTLEVIHGVLIVGYGKVTA